MNISPRLSLGRSDRGVSSRDAVRRMGFDGIHLDQYGFPKTAYSASGDLVDLATAFPPLIDRSRAAVVAARPSAGVIFNAVDNWPIETVASTSQDAVVY